METHKKQQLNLDGGVFYCIAFLDNNNLAIGNKNGSVHILSTDYLKKIHKIEGKLFFIIII